MASAADARSLLTSSDEYFPNVCAPCHAGGTQRDPNYYCNTCQQLLCAGCANTHNGMKISRNHNLVSMKNISKQPSKSCVTLCDCNQNIAVTEYCEKHRDVICQACKRSKHRRCSTVPTDVKGIHYCAKNLAFVAQKVQNMSKEIDEILNARNTALRNVATVKTKCKTEISTFRNELNAFLDLLEQNTMKELDELEAMNRKDIEHQLSALSTTKQVLQTEKVLLQDTKKFSGKSDMFSADVKISKHLIDTETLLKDIQEKNKLPVLEFKRNRKLSDMATFIKNLGTVAISYETIAIPKGKSFLSLKTNTSSQVGIKMQDDKATPWISGCVVIPDDQVVLCDTNNSRVKLLSNTLIMKDYLDLRTEPWDVSVINSYTVIITLPEKRQLQYIELAPGLKPGRALKLEEKCMGVAVAGQEIYVTCHNDKPSKPEGEVICLDMNGILKRKITFHQDGSMMFSLPFYLTASTRSGKIYVSDAYTSTVTCLTSDGSVVYQFKDSSLSWPRGLCIDGEDNIIVCGETSQTVHVVTAAGKKHEVLLTARDGIQKLFSVAFRYCDGALIFGRYCSNKLFICKMTV